MSRTYKKPTTAQERERAAQVREEKLEVLHTELAVQVAALTSGEQWHRWLAVAARFHSYSFNNTLMILAQRPDATQVAGYQAWRTLGRQVRKGEKGITVLAPVLRRRSADDTTTDAPSTDSGTTPAGPPDIAAGAERARPQIVGVKVTYVWDFVQTDGPPLPERPTATLLLGQAPEGLWDALAAGIAGEGFTLERTAPPGRANGLTDFETQKVLVRADVDDAQAVKTLIHELAHIRLHRPGSDGFDCRGVAEVEAESVAYLVAAAHGLDAAQYTIPYVAGWADSVTGSTPEDVVRQSGQRVLEAARWVLQRTTTATPAPGDELGLEALAEQSATLTERARNVRERAESRPAPQASTQGGPVPVDRSGPAPDAAAAELLAVHAVAADFYTAHLAGSWAQAYLGDRLPGIDTTPWRPGYAPAAWTELTVHLRATGFSDETLVASGLSTRSRRRTRQEPQGALVDRFRDRLMFPIQSSDGAVIAFVGRHRPDLDDGRDPMSAKYLNSPTTDLYTKGRELFGLAQARPSWERGAMIVITEGPLDAIAVTAATGGLAGAVAPLGTALTAEQVTSIHRIVPLHTQGRDVVVATDADTAGMKAAGRSFPLLTQRGADPQHAGLPTGEDPASLLAGQGPAALMDALTRSAQPLSRTLIDGRLQEFGGDPLQATERERVQAMRDCAQVIGMLPPNVWDRDIRYLATQLTTTPESEIRREVTVIGTSNIFDTRIGPLLGEGSGPGRTQPAGPGPTPGTPRDERPTAWAAAFPKSTFNTTPSPGPNAGVPSGQVKTPRPDRHR